MHVTKKFKIPSNHLHLMQIFYDVAAGKKLRMLIALTDHRSRKILTNPNEGHFWQEDHIKPVSEGGGQCDLDNIRTLCTRCHLVETEKLKRRLKIRTKGSLRNPATGMANIKSFFQKTN